MIKRTLSLLLAVVCLCALLAGCNSEPTTSPTTDTTTDTTGTTADSTTPADDATDATDSPAEPAEDAVSTSLPLADELTTISIWNVWSTLNVQSGLEESPNESLGFQKVEELTNVQVDWWLASDGATQFPLLLASGSYPDAFIGASYTTGSSARLDNYVDEEIILDLTDLIAELAPNYQAARTEDEDIARRTTTDDHRLLAFYNIKDTVQPSWLGYVCREDWLADGSPKTYDEYHEVLTRFKDEYGCAIPMGLDASGMSSFWMAGFDVGSSWIVLDGTVEHSITQPGFQEYLQLMNQWYAEGLIDTDFYSRTTGLTFEYAMCCDGSVGMFATSYTWMTLTESFAEDENFRLTAVEPPIVSEGDTRKIMISSDYHRLEGTYAAVFADTEQAELVVKYLDFFFTPEGSRLVDYGVEGESYYLDDNGEPQYMDHILNPADPGVTPSIAWIAYTANGMPHYYEWERELKTGLPENAANAPLIWDDNWVDTISFPAVSLTAEESEEYSAVMNDVETRISETIVRFIIGTESLDNFDSFVESLEGMGLSDAQAIQQAAYDRFMAR